MSELPIAADLFAYTDEAGVRGPARDLTPEQDGGISLLCALPVPAEHDQSLRGMVRPLFEQFKAAAPAGAALHITDAFRPGNEAWRAVAEQVRSKLFLMMRASRVILIYVARRARLARTMHERGEALRASAMEKKVSKVKIVGANRPDDTRIEDDVMISLALMLDAFAECENRKRVDIRFFQTLKALDVRQRFVHSCLDHGDTGDNLQIPSRFRVSKDFFRLFSIKCLHKRPDPFGKLKVGNL
jgi:hypothetical protein